MSQRLACLNLLVRRSDAARICICSRMCPPQHQCKTTLQVPWSDRGLTCVAQNSPSTLSTVCLLRPLGPSKSSKGSYSTEAFLPVPTQPTGPWQAVSSFPEPETMRSQPTDMPSGTRLLAQSPAIPDHPRMTTHQARDYAVLDTIGDKSQLRSLLLLGRNLNSHCL